MSRQSAAGHARAIAFSVRPDGTPLRYTEPSRDRSPAAAASMGRTFAQESVRATARPLPTAAAPATPGPDQDAEETPTPELRSCQGQARKIRFQGSEVWTSAERTPETQSVSHRGLGLTELRTRIVDEVEGSNHGFTIGFRRDTMHGSKAMSHSLRLRS